MTKFFQVVGTAGSVLLLGAVAFASSGEAGSLTIQTEDASTQLGADADAYTVSASNVSVASGSEGTVLITIKAKGDHKVNEEYPHKVSFDDPPSGVELPKTKLSKSEGKADDKKTFTFKVPVKGKSAGAHTITGSVKFSVCNDSQCVIKKETVKAVVTVK